MKKFFIVFFIFANMAFAESVTLYNDSPFELTAEVMAANGNFLARKTLFPNEQSAWSTDQVSTQLDVDYKSSGSYTPFTVIWKCSYEGIFSICYNISAGAMAVATQGTGGDHYCRPKPKKNQNE